MLAHDLAMAMVAWHRARTSQRQLKEAVPGIAAEEVQQVKVFLQVNLPEQGRNHALLQAVVMGEVREEVRVYLPKLHLCCRGSDEEQAGQMEVEAVAVLDHRLVE